MREVHSSTDLNFHPHFSSLTQLGSVITANSSVHGAILTTQVILPAGPWPQQPQELNSSPANSPMVLKFAFYIFNSPWYIASFVHIMSRKDSPAANYKDPHWSAIEQGLQIIPQGPQACFAPGHFLASGQHYG